MLSTRVSAVEESLTLALTAKAKALQAEGRDVIAFTAGELDFAPPPAVADAVAESLRRGETRYTPVAGTPGLRKAIAARLEAELHVAFAPEQVIVSCGAKHSLYNLIQVLCDPGDEVLIPAPYWLSYPAMAQLAEARPVTLQPSGASLKIDARELAGKITDRSRVLILNSPSNPTGAVYTEEELRSLLDVARNHPRLFIISDEIYDRLVFGEARAVSPVQVAPDLRERTVVVNGVSKSAAMTGLRIGWAAGPLEVIKACTRLQSHSTSGPASITQAAAEAALAAGNEYLQPILDELHRRRALMVEALSAMPGVTLRPPDGAFYCFPSVAGLLGREVAGRDVRTALDLAEVILERSGVVIVPGDPFGAPDHARLSFALATDKLEQGLERLAAFLRAEAG